MLNTKEFIENAVGYDHLADYLTADFGWDLAVWPHGAVELVQSNIIFRNEDAPLAGVKCPGMDNLDSTQFSEGWCSRDEDTGEYRELYTDAIIGPLEYVIRSCCMDGDMGDFYDELIDDLYQSAIGD